MNEAGTVAGRDHLRLFCALRLPDDVLDELAEWGRRELAERVVVRASLHITLAFLGRRPASDLPAIVDATRQAAAGAGDIVLEPLRYRETRSVGMIELGDAEGNAAALANDLFARLERGGVYRRERRDWLPHVTVMRFRRIWKSLGVCAILGVLSLTPTSCAKQGPDTPTIIIHIAEIQPHAGNKVTHFRQSDTCRKGNLFKFAARIVEEEVVISIIGDEQIGPSISVIVGHADTHTLANFVANVPLRRDILKGAITFVQKQLIGKIGRNRSVYYAKRNSGGGLYGIKEIW